MSTKLAIFFTLVAISVAQPGGRNGMHGGHGTGSPEDAHADNKDEYGRDRKVMRGRRGPSRAPENGGRRMPNGGPRGGMQMSDQMKEMMRNMKDPNGNPVDIEALERGPSPEEMEEEAGFEDDEKEPKPKGYGPLINVEEIISEDEEPMQFSFTAGLEGANRLEKASISDLLSPMTEDDYFEKYFEALPAYIRRNLPHTSSLPLCVYYSIL